MAAAHDVWVLLLIMGVISLSCNIEAKAKPQFTAMFVFGDSLNDPGNNIYFEDSIAKSNFWPYGLDWDRGPTGRFCNGKILIDFIAELLGLPILPSYASTIANGTDILSGVNYASAGAGILQDSGHAFNEEEMRIYLAKAFAFVDMGANDYLNNYLFPKRYRSSQIYTPTQFADLLIKFYYGYLSELHNLGLRKFLIAEVAPVGCSPFRVSKARPPPGECDSFSNDMVQMFNSRLKPLVRRLNKDFPGSVFTLTASFEIFIHLRKNANAYGLKVRDTACCGIGRNKGSKVLCPPNAVPCFNRDEYIFFDSAHPTQAANRILAQLVYNTTSFSFPVSIQQMANM